MPVYPSEIILPHELSRIAEVDAIEYAHADPAELEVRARQLLAARLTTGAVLPTPIKSNCSRRYTAVHFSGTRPVSAIKWVVMHAQESSTAESAAAWFANPDSRGSTQLCLDSNVCYRTLRNDQIPWGAIGANYRGFHIEQAGFTAWDADDWPIGTLKRSAFKTAWHLHLFSLPAKFLDAAALKRGDKGYTTHLECTRAFGGDHTDPGNGWLARRPEWHGYVTEYYAKL